MRISTNMIFDSGVARISDQQAALLKTQQQISANRRILSPSDDPIAAARALNVTQNQSLNTQYGDNRTQAKNALNLEENALQTLTTQIQNLQSLVVEAGNAAFDDNQRSYIATEIRGSLQEILGLANTRDSDGNYLFSGFQLSTQPFNATSTGATYAGDQGVRKIQVDSLRQMEINDTGYSVFENNAGSATFSVSPSGGFTNAADISSPLVTDHTVVTGHQYQVVFGAGGTTYSVNDVTTGTAVATNVAYTSPQSMTSIPGIKFSFSGTHAAGDTVTVNTTAAKGGNQSLFSTVTDLINVLETKTSGTVSGKFNLTEGLAAASSNLASSLDNVLTVRASVGARLKEIDSLDSAGEDKDLQYSAVLSDLQDLDYAKAASDLTFQKMVLEAAQQSFVKLSGMSLFNYL
ncbi:MAG: flgL [Burkholderiaceae bacterium]|nr:flgL [Burkholderiaceae bacterium]